MRRNGTSGLGGDASAETTTDSTGSGACCTSLTSSHCPTQGKRRALRATNRPRHSMAFLSLLVVASGVNPRNKCAVCVIPRNGLECMNQPIEQISPFAGRDRTWLSIHQLLSTAWLAYLLTRVSVHLTSCVGPVLCLLCSQLPVLTVN